MEHRTTATATRRQTQNGGPIVPEASSTLAALSTEGRNPRTIDLDTLDTLRLLEVINDEDRLVADAVRAELPDIARAVERITDASSTWVPGRAVGSAYSTRSSARRRSGPTLPR
jgi:hypothetical protein